MNAVASMPSSDCQARTMPYKTHGLSATRGRKAPSWRSTIWVTRSAHHMHRITEPSEHVPAELMKGRNELTNAENSKPPKWHQYAYGRRPRFTVVHRKYMKAATDQDCRTRQHRRDPVIRGHLCGSLRLNGRDECRNADHHDEREHQHADNVVDGNRHPGLRESAAVSARRLPGTMMQTPDRLEPAIWTVACLLPTSGLASLSNLEPLEHAPSRKRPRAAIQSTHRWCG